MRAFISYRTAEHRELVHRIVSVLHSRGIEALYDDSVLPSKISRSSLPLSKGTTYYLFGVIQSCDVVIHLVWEGRRSGRVGCSC